MFCAKCGAIMLFKKTDSKKQLVCSQCGYASKDTTSARIREEVPSRGPRKIEVVSEADQEKTLPETQSDCPNVQAFPVFIQIAFFETYSAKSSPKILDASWIETYFSSSFR